MFCVTKMKAGARLRRLINAFGTIGFSGGLRAHQYTDPAKELLFDSDELRFLDLLGCFLRK